MKKHGSPASAFGAAWLGWAFDGMDGFLYSLIAIPFVTELMGQGTAAGDVARMAAIIQAIFLVGWAVGGIVFGRIGDTIGRTRTLNLTIATYAIFTGLSFFAHTWWELAIFRFLAALGIGGEWAAGSALVAETLPNRLRPWASALLQSGYMVGIILASLAVGAFGSLPYRYVWLVGVIPAFMTLWIRRAVPETPEWQEKRATRAMPKISDLFQPGLLKTTLYTLAMASLALTCSWVFLYFSSQVVRGLPEVKVMDKAAQAQLIRTVTIIWAIWNIAGNFLAAAMARWLGYRASMTIMVLGALASYVGGPFFHLHTVAQVQVWLNLCAAFGLALFALFPLYIPPLFPTLLRTTGAGFCYNFGRVVAAVGTLYLGLSSSTNLTPTKAIYLSGFLFVPMLVIGLLMPVHRDPDPAVAEAAVA